MESENFCLMPNTKPLPSFSGSSLSGKTGNPHDYRWLKDIFMNVLVATRCMRHINGVYKQRFNRQNKKEGQLFRGRYKAVLVGGDHYLLEVMRYIHRNPLKAGLMKNLNEFSWSSHKAYLSKAKKWSWLHGVEKSKE